MLVYDNIGAGRIYVLAPNGEESIHQVQCKNACLFQKTHHPLISLWFTHQFNDFTKFEKLLVLVLGFFFGCFLTAGIDPYFTDNGWCPEKVEGACKAPPGIMSPYKQSYNPTILQSYKQSGKHKCDVYDNRREGEGDKKKDPIFDCWCVSTGEENSVTCQDYIANSGVSDCVGGCAKTKEFCAERKGRCASQHPMTLSNSTKQLVTIDEDSIKSQCIKNAGALKPDDCLGVCVAADGTFMYDYYYSEGEGDNGLVQARAGSLLTCNNFDQTSTDYFDQSLSSTYGKFGFDERTGANKADTNANADYDTYYAGALLKGLPTFSKSWIGDLAKTIVDKSGDKSKPGADDPTRCQTYKMVRCPSASINWEQVTNLTELFSAPAIITFLFFKVLTMIASIHPDK